MSFLHYQLLAPPHSHSHTFNLNSIHHLPCSEPSRLRKTLLKVALIKTSAKLKKAWHFFVQKPNMTLSPSSNLQGRRMLLLPGCLVTETIPSRQHKSDCHKHPVSQRMALKTLRWMTGHVLLSTSHEAVDVNETNLCFMLTHLITLFMEICQLQI